VQWALPHHHHHHFMKLKSGRVAKKMFSLFQKVKKTQGA
jgi:Fe2+ or Zn2+ uptake regulation protein